MAKQYEYDVVLTEECSRNPFIKRVTLILDHKITSEDQANLEKEYNSKGLIGISYVVTFYKLKKESGDFTYHVIYENRGPLNNSHFQSSCLCTLDHKVTVSTYQEDMKKFLTHICEELCEVVDDLDEGDTEISILGFQEIPEE
jgi:hypothetical protein